MTTEEIEDTEEDIPFEPPEPEPTGIIWHSSSVSYFGPDSRSILISGELDDETCSAICSQILELDAVNQSPITVWINTVGGSLVGALAIYDALRIVGSPIITVVLGACFSAGLLVLAAGDKRLATPNSLLFYHQPVMESQSAVYSAIDMDSTKMFYDWSLDKTDTLIRERAGIKKTEWKKRFAGRTSLYIPTDTALELGLIDQFIEYENKAILDEPENNG